MADPRTTIRRIATSAAGAIALSLAFAAVPAGAHVEPTVTEVPAGSAATLEFTVEHGCDGSPTTQVEFQVPSEIEAFAPVPKDGWTGDVVEGVVTYTGGSLAADQEDTFAIAFIAPDAAGATLVFPFIQTCEDGSTLDWIQTGDEPERPAPLVSVGAADPAAPTSSPIIDAWLAGDEPETTTTTTAAASTSTTSSTAAPAPTTTVPADDEGGSSTSGAPLLLAGVIVLTAIGVFAAARLKRRQGS